MTCLKVNIMDCITSFLATSFLLQVQRITVQQKLSPTCKWYSMEHVYYGDIGKITVLHFNRE